MSKYVFDLESDGLLDTITQIWMIVAIDISTQEKFIFTDHDKKYPGIKEALKFLSKAEMLVGHNILGYDLIALRKIYNWQPSKETKTIDTMLMSQVLDYNRFNGKHSLAVWGDYLGKKKVEHEDWSQYSEEMLNRCIVDTELNLMVYAKLSNELKAMSEKKPLIRQSLRNEHIAAQFCADAEFNGWLIDVEKANALLKEIEGKMKVIEDYINPQLRTQVKALDKEPKKPKFNKDGRYSMETSKFFGITQEDGLTDNPPIQGEFTRIEFVQPDIGSLDSVKLWLKTLGWVPTEYNWKKVGNQFIKVSEKLSSDSLEPLGEVGKMVDDYYTLRARHSIVSGWMESLDKNNRIHGSVFLIGTPTGRARHSGVVNVPSVDAMYGKEIRSLFISDPGYSIVGADSSGNQMRGLLHYLKNDEYTDLVINGDVHTKNAEILSKVVGEEVPRKKAKSLLYAFLFGAGSEKASLTVLGTRNSKMGSKILDEFTKATPGLKKLTESLKDIYERTSFTGSPWIPCIDGRKIYTDSPHKCLNYLLQSMEAVTCKASIAYAIEKLEKENIPYHPLGFFHDEIQIQVPDEFAIKAAEICKEAFKEGPKTFNVMIMDGESKIGKNYYETH